MNATEEKETNSQIAIIDEKSIRNKIYTIRNCQIMLDSDLEEREKMITRLRQRISQEESEKNAEEEENHEEHS